jgi:hypothetical protein
MNATFRYAKIERDDAGAWMCFRINELAPARAFVLNKKNCLYDLQVKEHREKRSLDANAYAWVLMDKLAEATHIPKEDIYREAIRNIGGNTETVCVKAAAAEKMRSCWSRNGLGWLTDTLDSKLPGCVNVVLYYGSSTYDREQMSRLIDNLVADCKALGIETLPPEKLSAMTQEWGR